uniref:WDR90 4th beta-propeller domain-containing protein n=1 Tax=Eutreptiella gymnastica TaxID=73025 RepID=A0A7S4FXE8_9EUGL
MKHEEDGDLHCVTWSHDGDLIISGSGASKIYVWKSTSGELLRTLQCGAEDSQIVDDVVVSPNGELLISGSEDGKVRVWKLSSGELVRTLEGHDEWVNAVAVSPDGALIASASDDYSVRVWKSNTGEHVRTLKGHDDYVYGVAFSADGQLIVSASMDGTARVWKAATGRCRRILAHPDSASVHAVAVSRDGYVISGSGDKKLRLWHLRGSGSVNPPPLSVKVPLKILDAHVDEVVAVDVSRDGQVASASADCKVKLWTPAGELYRTFDKHEQSVKDVAVSPDGERIASGSEDGVIYVWKRARQGRFCRP